MRKFLPIAVAALFCMGTPTRPMAQTADQDAYRMPPSALAKIVDAAPTPGVSVDPAGKRMLLLERHSMPSIETLSEPELRIAGLRLNPATNDRSRGRWYKALSLKSIKGGATTPITGLPGDARLRYVSWSPNGSRIAFAIQKEDGLALWVADAEKAVAQRLGDFHLNGVSGSPIQWLPDGKSLLCLAVPADRGSAPAQMRTPAGPVIQEAGGKKSPARTYQDLLKDPHDEALFEHHMQADLMHVSLDGSAKPLGVSGMVRSASISPDGNYIMVTSIRRPFSYLVPYYRFPQRVEIYDRNGALVHTLADLPLAESIPIGRGAVATGPRSFGWRADASATVHWVEAADGGNPRAKADVRDIVYLQPAPFKAEPQVLARLGMRYAGIQWGNDKLALVSEWWWSNRKRRVWRVAPGNPAAEPGLLFDYSMQDRYNNPGNALTETNASGRRVLVTDKRGDLIYLAGSGASPEGDKPFLDRLRISKNEKTRLWRSEPPYYESVVSLLDAGKPRFITRRESKQMPPNYFVRSGKKGKPEQLTDFPHPAPELAGVQKELVRYQRDDGVQLTGTLYLPAGYEAERDGPLPMLMWAYPREFKSAGDAGQVRGSPHRFIRTSWSAPVLWVTQGYAVLDDPAMPIVGEGDKEPNDSFVEQLVSSARAAVDEMVRRGVADRDRIAIAGHSYGAFMTANLLAHSDLFAAGIARSGAYNRTLTPFGFQAEERTLWQAPEIYFGMSPFMHAQKVNEPILLIHGEADNNSGTFPMQSRRYFNALKGHGAKARLVMLPHESHGYRSRESIMHTLWETATWLEMYVKKARPAPEKNTTTSMRGDKG